MDAPAPNQPIRPALRSWSPATFLGLAGLVAFAVCCRIDTCVVRWWLMLPLAAAGSALFLWRRARATGLESRICSVGFALLLALVVLRDVGLSRKLAGLFDTVNGYKGRIDQTNRELNRLFGVGR